VEAITIRLRVIISKPEYVNLSTQAEKDAWIQKNLVPWITETNSLYKLAAVSFDFVPSRDVETDGSVEQLEPQPDPDPLRERALLYPGHLVVFFRGHGGNGSSEGEYFHLEGPYHGLMAHELGHYLHLVHTFVGGRKLTDLPELIRKQVESHWRAKKALAGIGTILADGGPVAGTVHLDIVEAVGAAALDHAMDGDAVLNGGEWSVQDTPGALHELPPDFAGSKCTAEFPIEVKFTNGYTHTYPFRPDQKNIMGYAYCDPMYFSPDQIRIIRYALEKGSRRHLRGPKLRWKAAWTKLTRTTDVPPAVTVFAGQVHVFAKGIGDNSIHHAWSADGQQFSAWQKMDGTTDAALAATSAGGRLHLFAKGVVGNQLFHRSSTDGKTFTPWKGVGQTTNAAPAAGALGGEVHVFVKGVSDNSIHHAWSTDGQQFSAWQKMDGTTNVALAATSTGTPLHLFAKGVGDNQLYHRSSTDGKTFSAWAKLEGRTDAAPAAALLGGHAFVFRKDLTTQRMHYRCLPKGMGFEPPIEVPGGGTTDVGPAAAATQSRLYLFAKGVDDKYLYTRSLDLL
jgi:hypothetical protein